MPFDASILAGRLAPSSIKIYRNDFRIYANFAGSVKAALDPKTLARWRNDLVKSTKASPNTINRMLSSVKKVMLEAAGQGHTSKKIAEAFRQTEGVPVE